MARLHLLRCLAAQRVAAAAGNLAVALASVDEVMTLNVLDTDSSAALLHAADFLHVPGVGLCAVAALLGLFSEYSRLFVYYCFLQALCPRGAMSV